MGSFKGHDFEDLETNIKRLVFGGFGVVLEKEEGKLRKEKRDFFEELQFWLYFSVLSSFSHHELHFYYFFIG